MLSDDSLAGAKPKRGNQGRVHESRRSPDIQRGTRPKIRLQRHYLPRRKRLKAGGKTETRNAERLSPFEKFLGTNNKNNRLSYQRRRKKSLKERERRFRMSRGVLLGPNGKGEGSQEELLNISTSPQRKIGAKTFARATGSPAEEGSCYNFLREKVQAKPYGVTASAGDVALRGEKIGKEILV